jgi:hypothetical protein
MLKLGRFLFELLRHEPSSPNSLSLTASVNARSNPSNKQLDISPVDQNIANTNRRNNIPGFQNPCELLSFTHDLNNTAAVYSNHAFTVVIIENLRF